MDKKQLITTVKQICDEKNISLDSVIQTIEAALAAAYRKDFGNKLQNIHVEFDLETGDSQVFDVKTVVEDISEEEMAEIERRKEEARLAAEEKKKLAAEGKLKDRNAKEGEQKEQDEEEDGPRFNPKTEIQLSDAQLIDKKYQVGDELKTALMIPDEYGRMAAQTAKQVIIQKLREAERSVQYEDYKDRVGEMIVGTIHRREGNRYLVDLGNVNAVLPIEEQVRGERYNIGDRVRVLIVSVEQTTKGPVIVVSRAHPDVLRNLFEMEIPEIASGVVDIKSIAREPGSRSKVAVFTDDENIDPIGSCVGQRGARIQTIINELGGEKIDIIEWDDDIEQFISQAISPAKAESIDINEDEKSAVIHVPSDQLSLAIGKAGQNVRLAVKLTGWDLNIQEVGGEIVSSNDLDDAGEAKNLSSESDNKEQENADAKNLKDSEDDQVEADDVESQDGDDQDDRNDDKKKDTTPKE